MKVRILMVSTVALGAVLACEAPPPDEPSAASTQGVTAPDEAGAPSCAHPICAAGSALVAACDACASNVCARDPYCCAVAWDETCVGEVASICGQSCTAPPARDAGDNTCAHPICATGGALSKGCNTCVTALCAQDPYCCAVAWDATCVGEVSSICGQSCP